MFKNGDIVRIKEEHRSRSEKDLLYRVVNVNDVTGRCYIELVDCQLPLAPQELVSANMLSLVRAVPTKVSFNDQHVLVDAEGTEYTVLSCDGQFMSQKTGEIYCTAKMDSDGNVVEVEPLYQQLYERMCLLDAYSIDNQNFIYTVAVEPGYLVDVKVCSDSGLVYVMQNSDGSTVYREANDEITVPDYRYDENAVVSFAKEEHYRRGRSIKPSLSERIQTAESYAADIGSIDGSISKETCLER